MPILNPEAYYFLDTNGAIEHREGRSGVHWLRLGKDIFDGKMCVYVEFKLTVERLPDVIPTEDLAKIRSGEYHLALCNSHEAFHSVVSNIYKDVVIKLNIPPEHIILLSESADIQNEIQAVAKAIGREPFRSFWTRIFEYACAAHMWHSRPKNFINEPVLPANEYNKKYLNFNRRWRLHRPLLVALLHSNDILRHGHVSLAPCDDNNSWPTVWEWMVMTLKDNDAISEMLGENKESIFKIPALYLDKDELMTNQAVLDKTTDYLYRDTYFSVVTETNFFGFDPGRFVSEKIFKPITIGHPFILVTRPRTLELLRELGYQTFSPFIDESYDTEEDDGKRMLMIVAEIDRLCKLTPVELSSFLDGVRPICAFNRRLLSSKQEFLTC